MSDQPFPTATPPFPTTGPPPYTAPDRPIPEPAVQPGTVNVFNAPPEPTSGEFLVPFSPVVAVINGYVRLDDIAAVYVSEKGRNEFGFAVIIKDVPPTMMERVVATGFDSFEDAAAACDQWAADTFGIVGPRATHRRQ